MMPGRFRQSSAAMLALLFLLAWSLQAQATVDTSLRYYVRKYKNIQANQDQLLRLANYNHLINYYSSFTFFRPRHRVNPDFVRALILAESNADPLARSGKNALGLTQILYDTGKEAAKTLGSLPQQYRHVSRDRLNNLKPADLHDPAVNILLACYLIAKYNYNYDGRLELVLSAWNAGEGSIVGRRPPQYVETLDLIGKVNGYFSYFVGRKIPPQRHYSNSLKPYRQ